MSRFRGKYRTGTARLPAYDYASAGWYHVVICTKGRACFFGEVRGGIMGLSRAGVVADRYCIEIPEHSDRAVVDTHIVMPNHVHILIGLLPRNEDTPSRRSRDARSRVSTKTGTDDTDREANAFGPLQPGALPTIVHGYKGAVTRWARRNGHPGFAWQPRYWDRVVRSEDALQRHRRYISENPVRWRQDRYYAATPPR